MTGDIRPLVAEAVRRFGSGQPLFTLACFAEAVWDEYGLRQCPGPDWSRDVLSKLPYVTALSAGFYRHEAPPIGPAGPAY